MKTLTKTLLCAAATVLASAQDTECQDELAACAPVPACQAAFAAQPTNHTLCAQTPEGLAVINCTFYGSGPCGPEMVACIQVWACAQYINTDQVEAMRTASTQGSDFYDCALANHQPESGSGQSGSAGPSPSPTDSSGAMYVAPGVLLAFVALFAH